jgi:hypothetical protein
LRTVNIQQGRPRNLHDTSDLIVLALMMTLESFEVWMITEEKVAKVFASRKEASAMEVVEALKTAMARHGGQEGKRRSGRIES